MDPELQAQLDKITEISEDDLNTLEANALAEVEAITGDSDLEAAEAYKNAVLKAREEKTRRATEAAEREARAAAIKAELVTPDPEPEPEVIPDPEPEIVAETNPDEVIPDPEPEPQPEPVQTPQAVDAIAAAARPSLALLKTKAPQPKIKQPAVTITAAGDIPGYSAGQKIRTLDDLGMAFWEKSRHLSGSKGSSVRIASIETHFPEDRTLVAGAGAENTAKIRRFSSPTAIMNRVKEYGGLESLVAAGGLCAPVNTDYSLNVVATADRPVKASLTNFQATRGGLQFMTSATLGDLAAGIDVITEEEDTNSTSKPIVDITCGTLTEALVDAITLRLRIGNWNARFYPELFREWYELALAQHAREAESRLLQRIAGLSTAVTDGTNLGASRDLLESYGRLAAQQRNRLRMSPRAPFTALLPAWVQDMIREDLLRQAPGDNTYNTSDAQINSMFAARGIDVNWYLDEETGGTSMIYVPEAGGAGNPWITSVIGYLFPAGTFVFLDGGRLDLGTEVRDSTLNAANQVEAFLETFEGVARTGQQSLKVTNTVCVSGEFSAGVDFTCPGGGS